LRDMGFSLAMDDFGTGYSSLSYLRSHPFDVLKVDKTFVQELDSNPRDRELLKAAIDMAHALSLNVVAEGIETRDQLLYLREMGCDSGQGFLFCRPVPAEDIDRLLVAFSASHCSLESSPFYVEDGVVIPC
jgi:EAL domain-containing protein (putative c-di-GMP-specific phosphodiesterase class I)